MSELTLKAGPKLIKKRWNYDPETETGQWEEYDVTEKAHTYLFDSVTLADDVTLADLFKLVERDVVIRAIERRNFIEPMLEEVAKGVSPDYKPGYEPEGIEYLELYRIWDFDSKNKAFGATHRLAFHGVGFELKEDLDQGGFSYPAGERVHWGISCSNLRDLLALPIRLDAGVAVCESNLDSKQYGVELYKAQVDEVTLGQVIDGVMWELSFHGGPQETNAMMDSLTEQVEAIKDGTAETHPLSDLFAHRDKAGCDAMFSTIGDIAPHDVYRALRDVEDDLKTSEVILAQFEGKVLVKPEFEALSGMEFRAKFRDFSWDTDASEQEA